MGNLILARDSKGNVVATTPEQAAAFGQTQVTLSNTPVSGTTYGGGTISGTKTEFVDKKEKKPTTQEVEAKEIQRVKKAGGGYMASSKGMMKIQGDKAVPQQREVIRVPTKADPSTVIEIPISAKVSQKVQEAGGWEYVMQQNDEVLFQQSLTRYLEQRIDAEMTYKATVAAEFVANVIKMNVQAAAISSVFSATSAFNSQYIQAGVRLASQGIQTYGYVSRVLDQDNPVQWWETALFAASTAINFVGLYKNVKTIYEQKLVDPTLSKINVKEFRESKVNKVVPKYGEERMTRDTVTNKGTVIREEYKQDILGKPTDKPIQIRPYDKSIKIMFQHESGGIEKTKIITFKHTPDGYRPTENIDLQRYFPDQKKLFNILDNIGSGKIDITKGHVEQFVVTPANEIKTIFRYVPDSYDDKYTLRFTWVGVERPTPMELFVKPANIKSTINWDVYRNLDPETQKNIEKTLLFGKMSDIEKLGIKDLTKVGGIDNIDATTGEIQSGATVAALKPQPEIIDILKYDTPVPVGVKIVTVTPPFVDIAPIVSPNNIVLPIISPVIITTSNKAIRNDVTFTMSSQLQPDMEIVKNNLKPIIGDAVVPIDMTVTSPAQRTDMLKMTSLDMGLAPTPTPTRIDFGDRPEPTDFEIPDMPRTQREEADEDLFKRSLRRSMKGRNAISLNLPTASFYSLEKAAAKFGTGSLARGVRIEKIFRNTINEYGLATEFPAAEFLKVGKKPKKRRHKHG